MIENNFMERIVDNLKEHPEGLTILNLAANTGINRVTISKYIFGLVSQGLVFQRIVGTSKLCYLRLKQ